MPTNEIARSSTLYVLVADSGEGDVEYRTLLPEINVQWGFVQKADVFSAALRLQPWDLILIDESMIQDIPNDLLAQADIAEEGHNLILIVDHARIDVLQAQGMFDICGYLVKGQSLRSSIARVLRRNLYVASLRQERTHLEGEIERVLNGWEKSVRDRTRNLERRNRELQTLDELKSKFLENVSHELRTPLALVRSYVELLLDCPPESAEERTEFLKIIDSETRRLSRMIDDLLDLARIDAGSMRWQMREVSLANLTKGVARQLSAMLDKRSIACRVEIPNHVPAIWADVDRLSQVLINLIDNAMKHTDDGGAIKISAELVSENVGDDIQEMARVVVQDNGAGIPEDKLTAIFERFSQGEDGTQVGGAGLGLAICREIVSHHGGRIWAEPCATGARIVFTLALAGHLDVISGTYRPPE